MDRLTSCLLGFDDLWRRQLKLSAKDTIPEPASNAISILKIGEVVLKVVLLQLLVVCRKAALEY